MLDDELHELLSFFSPPPRHSATPGVRTPAGRQDGDLPDDVKQDYRTMTNGKCLAGFYACARAD